MRSAKLNSSSSRPVDRASQQAAAVRAGPKAPLGAANLMKLTEGLAKGFPDRTFGSAQGHASAQWMADQMKAIGLEPWDGESFLQAFEWDIAGEPWSGLNVAGVMRGTDPKLADEYIVVTAHHDSQPDTKQGANDNASGCAGVLAIAQAMAKDPPKRSVLFLTFDGEEGMRHAGKYAPGRRGSKFYANNPMVPLAKTAMLVNMDMIGQVHLERGPRSQIHQWASRDSFAPQILAKASKATLQPGEEAVNGYPEQHDQAQMFSTDAEPLYRLGVPTVNFLSGRDLDNHAPEDDMGRIIPERIEQYAKLAHRVTVEAANHPESLSQMGITPGGLMPTYPLIRANKGAATYVPGEEALRLGDLVARMPKFKEAAAALAADVLERPEIAARTGIDLAGLAEAHGKLLSEPVLHEVRTLHRALADELRGVDKNDREARKPLVDRLNAVGAVEDIVSGGIYVDKITKKGSYYMQQLPERLADLHRGAGRLGLDDRLDGVVFDSDVAAMTPEVTADRAVQMARETLGGLGPAVSKAAFALLDPREAARTERNATAEDVEGLTARMMEVAAGSVGAAGPDAGPSPFLAAALRAQLAGLKGSPKKWVDGFAAKNRFTDFDGFLAGLKLAPEDHARLLDRAQGMQAQPSAASATAFYQDFFATVVGDAGPVGDFDDLRTLSKPGALETILEEANARADEQRAEQLFASPQTGPELKANNAIRRFAEAGLELAMLFDPKHGQLGADVTLAEVDARLRALVDASADLPASSGVHAEIAPWADWIQPFLGLTNRAKEQAKLRTAAVEPARRTMGKAWATIADRLPEALGLPEETLRSPKQTAGALKTRLDEAKQAKRKDPVAQAGWRIFQVYNQTASALDALSQRADPQAEATLRNFADRYANHVGDELARPLQEALQKLDQLRALDDVQMGRAERGGPLSILAVRAVQDGKGNR